MARDGGRIAGCAAWAARVLAALAASAALAPGAVALAAEAAPLVANPALESRVMAVAEELRCLVCQNETIAASQADLAVDLRGQIREQLRQGRSEPEILDFMVQRYGNFVRYRPPLQPSTWLLWGGPFALLALALALAWRHLRQHGPGATGPAHSPAARAVPPR